MFLASFLLWIYKSLKKGDNLKVNRYIWYNATEEVKIMFENIVNKIEEYSTIIIYRHINPDCDALGSQFGLLDALRHTYPSKKIYVDGSFVSDLVSLYEVPFDIVTKIEEPALAIVLDTANAPRIDGESFYRCKESIKIDHHLTDDEFSTLSVVDSSAGATCQLIGQLLMEMQDSWHISTAGASALYLGIIADTNRFMYRQTDERTFTIAAFLMTKGIAIDVLYQRMYERSAKDLEIQRHILNNYHASDKVAYYILTNDDLINLAISRQRGSDYVNIFANIAEYDIWMAITEKDHNWRVSIRSKKKDIHHIAQKYRGGGHAQASGATLTSKKELESLLEDLKQVANSE